MTERTKNIRRIQDTGSDYDQEHITGKRMAESVLQPLEEKVNRKSKDSVFVDLFHRPEYLLQLYQALHPEDTEVSEDDLTIVTLRSLMIRMKYNDLGFMVSNRLMVLVEAQSKWTYNILVRFLLYVCDTYDRYIRNNQLDVYGSKRIELPQLELYVVYSGDEDVPAEISLSRHIFNTDHSDVEITAKVLKDSSGNNIINQYIAYARVYDEQVKIHGRTRLAVEETIRICRDREILSEYLKQEEVANIMFYEVDVDKELELMRKEEREEGRKEGRNDGIKEGCDIGKVQLIDSLVAQDGMPLDHLCEVAGISVEDYYAYKSQTMPKDN